MGTYHRKFNLQLNPPHVISEALVYLNVSSFITSIIGQTTRVLIEKDEKLIVNKK